MRAAYCQGSSSWTPACCLGITLALSNHPQMMDPDLNTKLCTHNPKRSLSSANRMPHPTDTSLTHSLNQSINQSINQPVYLSIYLSFDRSVCIYICMYVYVYIYIYMVRGSRVRPPNRIIYIYICMCVYIYIYIQSLSPYLSVSFYPCCCKSLSHGRAAGDFFGTEILHLKRQTPSHKARKQLIGHLIPQGCPCTFNPQNP